MWINGFWQSGFWVSGFWEGDALPPEVGGDLSPLAVAVQGIGFTPVSVAVHGFLAYIASGKSLYQDTDQGMAGKNRPQERNHYADFLNREFERKSRLQRDDMLATEFIAALLQMEMLDG